VRGVKLAAGDEVVSLTLLHHSDASTAEARAYLKLSSAARRAASGEEEAPVEDVEETEESVEERRYARTLCRTRRQDQFVLAVSENGFGKRTSSYEYRVTGAAVPASSPWAWARRTAPSSPPSRWRSPTI